MDGFIDLITTFPVVVFTAALIFTLTWWGVTTLFGGDDLGGDAEGGLSDLLGLHDVPLSVGLTVAAAGGWVASVLLGTAVRLLDLDSTTLAVATVAVVVVSLLVAHRFARVAARVIAPLYDTLSVPGVDDAVGSVAQVRGAKVDAAGGEVVVTSGPVRATILAARSSTDSEFRRGEQVLVIGRDTDGTWLVEDISVLDEIGGPGTE